MTDRICPSCKGKMGAEPSKETGKITCGNCGKTFKLKTASKNTPEESKRQRPQTNGTKLDKIDNMILELAVTYGMITSKQSENVAKMQNKLRQSGNYIPADQLLRDRGLISEKQIEQLNLSKSFLELRDQDNIVSTHAERTGLLTKKDIRQGFATQLKLFKEKKIVQSVSDIFIKLSLITEEERIQIYQELGLLLPGEKESDEKEGEEEIDFEDNTVVTEYEMNEDVKLFVTNDFMAAFIEVSDTFFSNKNSNTDSTAEEILDFVRENDIVYGITGTSFVVNCLESDLFKKQKRFKVASGIKPKIGKNASIKYYFETNYQRPGTITDEGLIDFRNRGEVPFVKKGDLIAEKNPLVEGHNGRDIKGYEIQVDEYNDIHFESGSGTEMSSDGLKIFAAIDGQPNASIKNVISVFPELKIKGDVDYSTGHVDFDGNVEILGTVKSGFKVSCCNLTAKEIIGGDIDITGDLNVSGGIIQANIKTEGNIKAFFIQHSEILSYGNLTVSNEIIDSNIGINGECKSNSCKIIATEISAKKGFEVKQIGNRMTNPCTIKAGLNEKFEKLIKGMKLVLSEKRTVLDEILTGYNERKDKQKTLLGSLTGQVLREELAENEQKNILKEIEDIKTMIEKTKKADDRPKLNKLKEAYKKQDKILLAAKERSQKIFDAQSVLIDDILLLYLQVEKAEKEHDTLEKEIELLEARYEKDASRPVVKVTGVLSGSTKVFGTQSSVILNGDISKAKVIELRDKPSNSADISKAVEYKMDIQRL